MKHLRRVGTSIVVAVFTAGLVSVSAPAANADDDGVSAAKAPAKTYTVSARRDSGWN